MTENGYRFYHCYQTHSSVMCHSVENENIVPSHSNSRLLFVSKSLPEILDIFVLNYKYFKGVKIIRKA